MSITLPLPAPILVAAPTGNSTLPIVEVPRISVETKRKQIRLRRGTSVRKAADCSFGNFTGHLNFDAWSFFHAAKKTELATSFAATFVDRRAMSFADEYNGWFVWNPDNFRRANRDTLRLEDFAESGLAGRFGEAIAYLLMVNWGFIYWDRIAALWERAAKKSGMTHQDSVKHARVISKSPRPDSEPDFAFEKASGEVSLMEAKGSFVHPGDDNPSTKSDLQHGLKQLAAWTKLIHPLPLKSYAIGTYFRDISDNSGDPSLIVFVDPPGSKTATAPKVAFPPDWIRRGNYGAWLLGMGFVESGHALRSGREVNQLSHRLPIVNISGREFAVVLQGVRVKRADEWFNLSPWFDPLFYSPDIPRPFPPNLGRFLQRIGITAIQVLGIESDTLALIEEAIGNGQSEALLSRGAGVNLTTPSESQGDSLLPPDGFSKTSTPGFSGSIMPDGTIVGEIAPELLEDARIKTFKI